MKTLLQELYSLNDENIISLRKKFSDEALLRNRSYFAIGKMTTPVNLLHIYYYIDREGDFINTGKKIHHKIARGIFDSLAAKDKIQVLEYIDDMEN